MRISILSILSSMEAVPMFPYMTVLPSPLRELEHESTEYGEGSGSIRTHRDVCGWFGRVGAICILTLRDRYPNDQGIPADCEWCGSFSALPIPAARISGGIKAEHNRGILFEKYSHCYKGH